MRKRKTLLTRLIRWAVILTVLAVIPWIITTIGAIPHTYTIEEADHTPFGVVLAAETINGRPSAVLRDRIQGGDRKSVV